MGLESYIREKHCYLLLQRIELQRTPYKQTYGMLKFFQKLNADIFSDISRFYLIGALNFFMITF